ncbi:MAG: DUF1446 domain-containing protein [Gammaproteobacteria bacterium]|nr:DUF1446 domain-containing protein [Gammaproteobacteria bacterium]MDH3578753.1 DUF1446 domain-containing protein [Gammaproteobacteria bacterium]
MKERVRIGCASAFYGDSQLAARQLVENGDIDYLVFDYLAETTMAILSRARMRDENLGYAVDFVTVAMHDVLADCAMKGIKVVANAGGVNVPACIVALEAMCEELNIDLTIAGVYGDDLADRSSELRESGLMEMETGEPLPEKLASLNAYLGARPIADALAAGADIVVTGRVVDSAVVLGPLMHEFGWSETEYDKLAQGSLAGHVIECGAQCTGGNFTDWHLVPDFSKMSYPVAEVSADGSFVVTIPHNTGGLVSIGTVAEQLLYEIGDPANYLLPDVACDFSNVRLSQVDKYRVGVSGAKGRAPGSDYKVCGTYIDGFRLMGSFFMGGPRVADKIRTSLNAWVDRTKRVFEARGLGDYRDVCIEVIGAEDTYGPHARTGDTREAMGKYGLHHDSREALQFAAAEVAYLATSATPGMSAFGAGRARPQPLMRVHSALLAKEQVQVQVQVGNKIVKNQSYQSPGASTPAVNSHFEVDESNVQDDWVDIELGRLVYARSGDKGRNANVGVIARHSDYVPIMLGQLTASAVADYFAHLLDGTVERFEMPGLNALNFVLTDALGGGGGGSLRVDSQGKSFAQMLLSMTVKVPPEMAKVASANWL